METTFRIDRSALNETLKLGIRHTQDRSDMSYCEIALRLGYRTGSMIEQVMARPEVLPGPLQLVRASRLFSENGFDRLADACSCEGKRTLPVPTVFDTLLNGSILDEISDNAEALGHAISAFRAGRLDESERQTLQAIGALFRQLAEIHARRHGLPLPAGDALPGFALTIEP